MRVFLKRRALSTVVTSAILLTAVAVIGTGVVLWSNSNLKSFENTLVTSASDKTNKINEIPIIENVILDPNNGGSKLVNVTVTNAGTVGFTVTNMTLINSTHTCNWAGDWKVGNNHYLSQYCFVTLTKVQSNHIVTNIPQNSTYIPIHSSKPFSYVFKWVNGYIATIQLTTSRGTVISTQAVHP